MRKVIVLLLAVLAALFFFIAVYPGPVFEIIGIPAEAQDDISRAVEYSFTALLAVIGFLIGAVGLKSKKKTGIDAANWQIPAKAGRMHEGHAEPCKRVIIFDRFTDFHDREQIATLLKKACILGNVKPLFTSSMAEAERLISLNSIFGIVCTEDFQEEFKRVLQKNRGTLFVVRSSDADTVKVGNAVRLTTIQVPKKPSENVAGSIAKQFARLHSLDTPRGLGFSGNWLGTYGLMAIHQAADGGVSGKYWYANGELTGRCEVDIDNQRLLLFFDWSQRKNSDPVGSRDFGQGLFVIPAGYEILYGYWYDKDDVVSSQTWCAARVSRDITDNILSGGGIYAKDMGLSIHDISHLYDWDTAIEHE